MEGPSNVDWTTIFLATLDSILRNVLALVQDPGERSLRPIGIEGFGTCFRLLKPLLSIFGKSFLLL